MRNLRYTGPLLLFAVVVGIAACSDRNIPVTVSTHPDGWVSPQSDEFHGTFVLESASKGDNCATCHGEDFAGGTSGVSCYQCHAAYPHPDDFKFPSQANFHGKTVAQVAHWDLSECQSCHGEDYAGKGVDEKNCRTCHTAADGPEDCQTCHGGEFNAAPPEDLSGHSDPMFAGVGAHQEHLQDGDLWTTGSVAAACSNCHVVPPTYDAPGHIDGGPVAAEVTFGNLATHGGTLSPSYDASVTTCSGTYCHGGFVFTLAETENPRGYAEDTIEGNNVSVVWTQVGTGQAECGTCHSIPPTGHIDAPANRCFTCHSAVVDADLNIINPSLHINGEVNVFGNGIIPFGGSE